MPNIGGAELIFILAIVLIVFGAGKLPDVLAQLGKGVKSFREESTGEGTKSSSTAASDQPKHS